jgi:molybdopterin synthase catalytic subunit
METINVRVRFFGRCRELAGTDSEWVKVPAGETVKGLVAGVTQEHPSLAALAHQLLVAVNEEYATPETTLSEGDTMALFPPVSGGQTDDLFQITREPIDTPGLVRRLLRARDGAVVAFEGVVRNHSMGKPVLFLEYEAYEEMALKMMRQIGREVRQQWPIDRIGITHRLGRLDIGEASVTIVVVSAHRRPAFAACQYAIDRLKTIVPIWKREYFEDGAVWVEGEGDSHESHL